jgi:hypothetical protein
MRTLVSSYIKIFITQKLLKMENKHPEHFDQH